MSDSPRSPGRLVLVAAVALSLTGCVTVEVPLGGDRPTVTASAPAGAPTPAEAPDLPTEADPPSDAEAQVEQRVAELVDEARSEEGLDPLERHDGLDDVARRWSQHLSAEGLDLAHNPTFSEQVPSGWSATGENVGWIDEGGRLDPGQVAEQLHEGWMASPGHRENILRAGFTHVGVGVAHDPDRGYHATQNFATY